MAVMNVLTGVETVAKDVAKGIAYPFRFAVKAEKVLATAIKDQPELKDMLTELTAKIEGIGADALKDIGEKGLNIADDMETIVALKDLFGYFVATVKPEIIKVYGEIQADVAGPDAA